MGNKFPEVDFVSGNPMINDNIAIKEFTWLAITILPGFE